MPGRLAIALAGVLALGAVARADRSLCGRGVRHHGAPVDLDVVDADVQDVLRLLADTGDVSLVIADDVRGTVTLHVKRVPWDRAACTVAALRRLTITVHDGILLVRARPAR